jgi:hypothetical protein
LAEYEIVNNKSNDFSAQNLRPIRHQVFLTQLIAYRLFPLVVLTDSLAIVIILWHEKYWESFFPGVPRWIAGMFYLEPISKMSFGPISLLAPRFKSSTYSSMPAV